MSIASLPSRGPNAYAQGCLLVLAAGVLLSSGGLIVRHIAVADDWQIVFYRSAAAATCLLLFMAVRRRGDMLDGFRRAGPAGLIAGAAIGVSMITFILAINAISVANTLFLLSASPFMAALLGWMLLRETIGRVTWVAMMGALVGVGIMVWQGVALGTAFGNLMALVTALGFAVFAVALRFGRMNDMAPAVCFAGMFSAGIAAAVAWGTGSGLAVPVGDLILCLAYGGVIAIALVIFTVGSRTVPAAELTLLSLSEVVLGPVWVWLVIAEVPSPATVLGGAVLLTAIAGQALFGIARR